MKKRMRPGSETGAAMLWVVCIFTVTVILSGAMLTCVLAANNVSIRQQNARQAYFTARSAVQTTVAYLENHAGDNSALAALLSSPGAGRADGMGSYSVKVSNENGLRSRLVVSATADFRGEKSTVAAHLYQPDAGTARFATDYLFCTKSLNAVGSSVFNGDLCICGSCSFSGQEQVTGKAIVDGNALIENQAAIGQGLFCSGSLTLHDSGAITGPVTVGSLQMDGSTVIQGNVQCKNDAAFSGGLAQLKGTLALGGGLTPPDALSYVTGGVTATPGLQTADIGSCLCRALPEITLPNALSASPAHVFPGALSQNVIDQSGLIDYSKGAFPASASITVDTDAEPDGISLLFDNADFDLDNTTVQVTGSHNLYLYLEGNSSVNLLNGARLFNADGCSETNPPRIFIFVNGSGSVTLSQNTRLDAYVYNPDGDFEAQSGSIFNGSGITRSVAAAENVQMTHYSPRNAASTPICAAVLGTGGRWSVERWDSN